jgi:hypothetical protein
MSQKHALLFVPNYDQSNPGSSAGTTGSPLSYLRLGSTISTAGPLSTMRLRGDDLLHLAGILPTTTSYFADDARKSQEGGTASPALQVQLNHSLHTTTLRNAGTSYYRHDGSQTTNTGAAATRPALTGELMTRGGWRDHTDGNRIITVRGDRVDVVMGNYRRVVFGRVANSSIFGNATSDKLKKSYWEVSGGHIWESTSTGVASLKSIEWVKESVDNRDVWKVVEETARGDVIDRYSGRVETHFNGPSITTKTGVDSSDADKNPHMLEIQYVKKSKTDVFANKIESDTTVDYKYELNDGSASGTSGTTSSGADFEDFEVNLVHNSVMGTAAQYVDTFNDELWTKNQDNVDVFGVNIGFEFGGQFYRGKSNAVSISLTYESFSLDVGASGLLYIGTKTGIRIGPSIDIGIGYGLDFTLMELKVNLNNSDTAVAYDDEKHVIKLGASGMSTKLGAACKKVSGFLSKT